MEVEKTRIKKLLKFIILLCMGLFVYLMLFDKLMSDSIVSMLFWTLLSVAIILLVVGWVIKKP